MRKLVSLLFILVVLVNLLLPINTYAIGNPTAITIDSVGIFRSLWETGDQLYYIRYHVTYAVTPTEDATTTWQMGIYDSTGTTLLFSRPLNYYQENIISLYLTPAQALVWGGGTVYKLRIMGNPSIFSPLVEGTNMRTWTTTASDYQTDNSLDEFVIAQALILQADWGITLIANDVLNTTGSTYWKKCIPNLDSLYPELFSVAVFTPSMSWDNYPNTYEQGLQANKNTQLEATINNIATLFGTTGNWMTFFIALMFAVILAGLIYVPTQHGGIAAIFGFIGSFFIFAWLGLGNNMLTLVTVVVLAIAFLFGLTFILARFR